MVVFSLLLQNSFPFLCSSYSQKNQFHSDSSFSLWSSFADSTVLDVKTIEIDNDVGSSSDAPLDEDEIDYSFPSESGIEMDEPSPKQQEGEIPEIVRNTTSSPNPSKPNKEEVKQEVNIIPTPRKAKWKRYPNGLGSTPKKKKKPQTDNIEVIIPSLEVKPFSGKYRLVFFTTVELFNKKVSLL